MKKMFIKTILAIVLVASTGAFISTAAMAQADSTSSPRALTGRGIVPLNNQERETPQVNNNTTVVQNVTQQIGGADRIQSSGPYLNSMPDATYGTCGSGAGYAGSAGSALACGSRACQSFGYVGGYASEVAWPDVGLICFK